MAELEEHGGGCCGIRHIYGMDNSTYDEVDELIAEVDNEEGQGNRLIEIILSSRQVGAPGAGMRARNPEGGWPAFMQSRGFRLVSRFNNSNSGNDCYIFHRVPHFLSTRPGVLPFTWTHGDTSPGVMQAGGPGQMPAPRIEYRDREVQAPVRDVAVFYRNRFADNREGALYTNVEACERSAPRCRIRERVVIRSDNNIIVTRL